MSHFHPKIGHLNSASSSSSSSSSRYNAIHLVLLSLLVLSSSLAPASASDDVVRVNATCADSGSDAAVDLNVERDVVDDDDDPITARLLDWLRDNGAYVNDKLVVRRVDPNDLTSPRGVFAADDMETGETVCVIPWGLMIKPSEGISEDILKEDDCLTLYATYDAIRGGVDGDGNGDRDGDDGEAITPYARYLLEQPIDYLPSFWSKVSCCFFFVGRNDSCAQARPPRTTHPSSLLFESPESFSHLASRPQGTC